MPPDRPAEPWLSFLAELDAQLAEPADFQKKQPSRLPDLPARDLTFTRRVVQRHAAAEAGRHAGGLPDILDVHGPVVR